jgi:hypothetical protein
MCSSQVMVPPFSLLGKDNTLKMFKAFEQD